MKICSKCKVSLPLSDFARKGSGHQTYCKKCKSIADKALYQNSTRKDDIRNRHRSVMQRNRQYIYDHLSSNPCVDCGESDPVILEFDHVGGEKLSGVTQMIKRGFPTAKIAEEIEKCEVRCCNCHRRRTSIQNKSWMLNMGRSPDG